MYNGAEKKQLNHGGFYDKLKKRNGKKLGNGGKGRMKNLFVVFALIFIGDLCGCKKDNRDGSYHETVFLIVRECL